MDRIREEFEAWFYSEIDGNSVLEDLCWQAWQASRAALVVELPKENYHSNTEYEEELVVRLDRAGIRYE